MPLVLFVFETPADEDTFLRFASRVESAPLFSSNVETITERGVLGHSWRMPRSDSPDRWPLKSLAASLPVPQSN